MELILFILLMISLVINCVFFYFSYSDEKYIVKLINMYDRLYDDFNKQDELLLTAREQLIEAADIILELQKRAKELEKKVNEL